MNFNKLNDYIKNNDVLGINKADAFAEGETISTKVTKDVNDVLNVQKFKLDGKEVSMVYLNTEVSDRVKFSIGAGITYKAKQAIDILVSMSNNGKKQFSVVVK